MELRPYQKESVEAVFNQWNSGIKRTLLVLPTGCGKTIVFSKIAEQCVRMGHRVLILAHRGELLEQASDKLYKATGLKTALEKAESSCLSSYYRVVVGSIQSLQRESRLHKFSKDYFDTIIVDEAHHVLSDGYQTVLNYFDQANVLGVTATADRGDMRNLGEYFETLAYEYTLPKAIKSGYLSPIKAVTIPLQIDLSSVGIQTGDFKSGDLGTALDPYLEQIANEMVNYCSNRKTVVFTPLIETSKKFTRILNSHGFKAVEVNGNSDDRSEVIEKFDKGEFNVICNSMLLCLDLETEILTSKGFKKYNELTEDDFVANWNFDGTVFFEKPKEIVIRDLYPNENMVSINSRTINLRVTNTHRMVVQNSTHTSWVKIPASDLRNGLVLPSSGVAEPFETEVKQETYEYSKHAVNSTVYYLMKKGACENRDEAREIAIKSKEERKLLKYKNPNELSLDECRLIGFWIADGTKTALMKKGFEYKIAQSERYTNIINWFDKVLENLKLTVIKRRVKPDKKSKYHSVTWSLSRGTGFRSQKTNGVYSIEPYLNKNGTELFWGLNEKQFDALIEGFWYGDGYHGTAENGFTDNVTMTNTNYELLNLFCAIASVRGWRCSLYPTLKNHKKFKDQFCLHLIKNRNLHISCKTKIINEQYKPEKVWCVKTSSKNIITRRNGKVTVMGNTEGWDCPSVDCVIMLRPTKVRSLYCQCLGRGTRLYPGKTELLVLDFLWHTERHELCHPASLIAPNEEINKAMTKRLEDNAGMEYDLEQLELDSAEDVLRQREEALAEQLAAMKKRKRKFVDPLQFEMSIQAEDLVNYVPAFGYEMGPASKKQLETLEKFGIFTDEIENAGKAQLLLDRLIKRSKEGLTTPKQIRFLEQKGFVHVGTWQFEDAKKLINRIAANHWMVPFDINTETYKPGR